jgi:hypothetical protein
MVERAGAMTREPWNRNGENGEGEPVGWNNNCAGLDQVILLSI